VNSEKTIINLYVFFYKAVYKSAPTLESSRQVKKLIANYLESMHASDFVGSDSLIDYFCYQWNYWYSLDTRERVQLSWLLGDKARERWSKRNREVYRYYYKIGVMTHCDIAPFDLLNCIVEEDKPKDTLSQAEENEKTFFEGAAQLAHCLEKTSLFHPKSKACRECSERVECKLFLAKENFDLYVTRGLLYDI
jgi:hypothetical protein